MLSDLLEAQPLLGPNQELLFMAKHFQDLLESLNPVV